MDEWELHEGKKFSGISHLFACFPYMATYFSLYRPGGMSYKLHHLALTKLALKKWTSSLKRFL